MSDFLDRTRSLIGSDNVDKLKIARRRFWIGRRRFFVVELL